MDEFINKCPQYTVDGHEKKMEKLTGELDTLVQEEKALSEELLTLQEKIGTSQTDLKGSLRAMKNSIQKDEHTIQKDIQEALIKAQERMDAMINKSINLQEKIAAQEQGKAGILLNISTTREQIKKECKDLARSTVARQIKHAKKGLVSLARGKRFVKRAYTHCTQMKVHQITQLIMKLRSLETRQRSLHQQQELLTQQMKREQDRFKQGMELAQSQHGKSLVAQQEEMRAAHEKAMMAQDLLLKDQARKSQEMQQLIGKKGSAENRQRELAGQSTTMGPKTLVEISTDHAKVEQAKLRLCNKQASKLSR